MSQKTLTALRMAAESLKDAEPAFRLGQAYMTALWTMNKDLYDRIQGTDKDPFYVDSKLFAFYGEIVAYEDK